MIGEVRRHGAVFRDALRRYRSEPHSNEQFLMHPGGQVFPFGEGADLILTGGHEEGGHLL